MRASLQRGSIASTGYLSSRSVGCVKAGRRMRRAPVKAADTLFVMERVPRSSFGLRWLRRHLNYANVIATLALFFAITGGALAAKHYLINSTKQINPKVMAKNSAS